MATRPGRLVSPMIVTSCFSTIRPFSDSGQLPPRSTARSTSTEPGFMAATVSAETSVGAGRPGISAVAMTMSACLQRSDTSAA
ncbi:hypothetical protein D3C86_1636330 [compost metagenome]